MRDEAGGTVLAAVPLNSPSWWVQTGDCTSPHYIMRGGAAWQHGSMAAAGLIFSRQPTAGGRVSIHTDAVGTVTLHLSSYEAALYLDIYFPQTTEKPMHDDKW